MNRFATVEYQQTEVISCAQNMEDVLLFRALFGKREGFYVDVGAGDPNWDSVTNWFYRLGWRGINIEPNPTIFPIIQQWRPRDINLNIGISDNQGVLPYYQVQQNGLGHGWGLSSFDPGTRDLAGKFGLEVSVVEVQVKSLWDSIVEYIPAAGVDFLKIDVEGLEKQVIDSANLSAWQPKIICAEAVEAASAKPSFGGWEHLITVQNYDFAIFDGVNNYYVHNKYPEIFKQFLAGVNVSDRYRRATLDDFNFEDWRAK
ncbi:FkbM family methyltransferase [Rhizobium sp. CNPSo 3968]|uniref:FkbM family methyltransferase n=1 Tax=Rhizobium sp. CNPSo 3968 TaxID=3021408 RepID=UPI00254C2A34|nr:FkbM family methyltransferase [Rhizobium sp. CNPSo 3968]MDK4724022.1 FkbM family methyltransferase [Rhizobium sp. CNPSo 3968]